MKTVVIAAGHSNTDSGAINGEHKESVLMASFRNAVAVYLRSNGIRVVTDGTGLVNKPLKESISLIKGSDLAIEFQHHLPVLKLLHSCGIQLLNLSL